MKKPLSNTVHLVWLLAYAGIAAFLTTSCQRVIKIDLNTDASKVVIEGFVTDQLGIDTVKLTRTGSYFAPGTYPTINGAVVIITDDAGHTDTLPQVDSGRYVNPALQGVPGRTYTMKVFVDGKEYDAVSKMPLPVDIDSVVAIPTNSSADTGFRIRCFFKDPVGVGNFYRAQLFINGQLQYGLSNLTLFQDKYTDGIEENLRLRGYTGQPGDTARVDLMSIDDNTYNYFSVLRSISGSSNPISTATPQNPPSNIIGNAVGYFAAYPIRSRTIIIQ
jgi:hypothetical protein